MIPFFLALVFPSLSRDIAELNREIAGLYRDLATARESADREGTIRRALAEEMRRLTAENRDLGDALLEERQLLARERQWADALGEIADATEDRDACQDSRSWAAKDEVVKRARLAVELLAIQRGTARVEARQDHRPSVAREAVEA